MNLSAANLLLLAAILPLVSFLILIFWGRKLGRTSCYLATLLIAGSFAISVMTLISWVGRQEFNQPHYVEAVTYRWMPLDMGLVAPAPSAAAPTPAATLATPPAGLQIGLLVDSLTVVMFVMITLIATLVHLFSVGYMTGDPRFSRFFAYLGLFCFSMLGLVLANSLLQLFAFWELVGLCSYLLIGFWFERTAPAMASKKAFVVNRIGDAGFLIGLGLLLAHVGPAGLTLFDSTGNPVLYTQVCESLGVTSLAGLHGFHWLTWCGICLFAGAMAKSAQFPLHVWLPDAMEGPTPVSALIHAATMVAAGVYLVARVYPILTPEVHLWIAIFGCVTLLMAALIALVMVDIKKILAYSTISQLGFMMLFLGAGGYVAALFHLLTHAFFKACLFLGSGSVIHGCHHEQDITRMGGLWKKMPVTAVTFLVSVLAIAGTPGFSGFFSKELGLEGVHAYSLQLGGTVGRLLYLIPAFTAYLTAFYMWRCWWLTFGGRPRDAHVHDHAHESGIMTLPLVILGILAVIAGYPFLGLNYLISKSAPDPSQMGLIDPPGVMEAIHDPVAWGCLVGPLLAIAIYANGLGLADRIRRIPGVNLIYIWLKNKMFFDEFYDGILVAFSKLAAQILAWFDLWCVDGLVNATAWAGRHVSNLAGSIDTFVVDGLVNDVASLSQETSRALQTPQNGRIRLYLFSTLTLGTLTLLGVTWAWIKLH